MSKHLSIESIQSIIDYKTKQLQDLLKTIDYYKSVGANKDLSWEYEQVNLYNEYIDNYKNLLIDNSKEINTIKVRVTSYKGNVIIETINPNEFDQDFNRPILGNIGCSLKNTKRLEISQEAIDTINKMKSTGYGMGDFMGNKDYFSWVGPENVIKTADCVKSNDYRLPLKYNLIDNIISDNQKYIIDNGKHLNISKPITEIKYDLWIELRQHSAWLPKEDDSNVMHNVYSDFYTVDVTIHNRNEKHLPGAIQLEIKESIKNLFSKFNGKYTSNYGFTKFGPKIPQNELMPYINALFNIGFDNNIMNPDISYWRMSMNGTIEEFKNAIKSFKNV